MKTVLALLIAALPYSARADAIGNIEYQPGASWKLLTSYNTKLPFSSGRHIPMQNRVYYVAGSDGVAKAMLVISSTDGTNSNKIEWVTKPCSDPRPNYFTDDFGSSKTTRISECLIVNSSFAPYKYFNEESEVYRAAAEQGIKMQQLGYSFRSTYGASTGSMRRVNLMTTKAFKGLPTPPTSTDLHEVSPNLVAMGEAIHAAVKSSVLSMDRHLTLPPIALDDE